PFKTGIVSDPNAVPNRDPGISNQFLNSKAFSPPWAVMLRAGYIYALETFTLANACHTINSLLFTSGLLLNISKGIPTDVDSGVSISVSFELLIISPGIFPVRILREFS